jgi:hypothetical protein
VDLTNGAVNVSWPSSYFEWTLYQNTSTAGGSAWVQVPSAQYQNNGTTKSVNVALASGNNFYRLQKN